MKKEDVYRLLEISFTDSLKPYGEIGMIEFLIEFYGAEYFKSFQIKDEWFVEALEDRKFPIIKCLIELGYDVNQTDQVGNNVLMYVIEASENIELFRFLIRKGIDVNRSSKIGKYPILFAMGNDRLEEGKILYENGAKLDMKSMTGEDLVLKKLELMHPEKIKKWIDVFLTYPEKLSKNHLKFMKEARLELLFS